ncbi:MAG TPA: ribosomal RNA small subunit methyltransferase A [Phycisphaerales bacterium]|nr:ribosomal RNA small subunit methyltransferase A [Phycisphaerales bacterium]
MQTKQQIRQLLLSAGVSPNKRLGQHFLIDLNLMRLLVDSAGIKSNDVVLEVGCGTGSLTKSLAERAGRVIAVELDRNLAEIAGERLAISDNTQLINTDILESKHTINRDITGAVALARKKHKGRFLLVANLPYNVASPVMMNLLTGPTKADAMYVTVQKEVAERMTAEVGSGHYGILSIFLAATGDVRTIRVLKPTVFWPQPQVDSAMVGFVRDRAKSDRIADMELFGETVHLFMSHRRKTVRSCCKFAEGRLARVADWPEIFEKCGIDPAVRPEKLSPEDYVAISGRAAKSVFLS